MPITNTTPRSAPVRRTRLDGALTAVPLYAGFPLLLLAAFAR